MFCLTILVDLRDAHNDSGREPHVSGGICPPCADQRGNYCHGCLCSWNIVDLRDGVCLRICLQVETERSGEKNNSLVENYIQGNKSVPVPRGENSLEHILVQL